MNSVLRFFATGPEHPRIADAATVDELYRRHRLRVMLAITLGYGVIYTCRLALGVVKKPLIDSGMFGPAELGLIGSALFYTYALGKLTNGFLADHANMKRFLAAGFLLSAICNIGMGFSTLAVAVGVAVGIERLVPEPRRAGRRRRDDGVVQQPRARPLLRHLEHGAFDRRRADVPRGRRSIVAGWAGSGDSGSRALVGLCAAVVVYLLVQDRPQTLGLACRRGVAEGLLHARSRHARRRSVFATQFSILKIPAIWVLALSSATIYVTRYAINCWGVLYLQEARGYSLPMAGTLLMISTVAGMVGAVAYGFISDKAFHARRPPANLLFAILELVGSGDHLLRSAEHAGPDPRHDAVRHGPDGPGHLARRIVRGRHRPKRAAGAAMGLIGIFSYIGAAVQENVSGHLIERNMTVVDGVRTYDFGPAIWFWIAASFVSMLLAASLWRVRLRD